LSWGRWSVFILAGGGNHSIEKVIIAGKISRHRLVIISMAADRHLSLMLLPGPVFILARDSLSYPLLFAFILSSYFFST